MKTLSPGHSNELVINWHLTEACNYGCRYCYSRWHGGNGKELLHDAENSQALLRELYHYFSPENHATQAQLGMRWNSVRLSLAGGEPLLYEREVVRLATFAKELGFNISLISNGSRLNDTLMSELAPLLSVLGLSLDSANPDINRQIGRVNRKSQLVSLAKLAATVNDGRALNPDMRLKINTVVNALNFTDNLSETIALFNPDKWKVLRVLPAISDDLAIAKHEFAEFLARHHRFAPIISAEDNSDMVESYIMIDPHGRFFQNSSAGQGYRYSEVIPDVGAKAAFRQISWIADKFRARYAVDRSECLA